MKWCFTSFSSGGLCCVCVLSSWGVSIPNKSDAAKGWEEVIFQGDQHWDVQLGHSKWQRAALQHGGLQRMAEALSPCLPAETQCTERWVLMLHQLRALFPPLSRAPLLCPAWHRPLLSQKTREGKKLTLQWVQTGLGSPLQRCCVSSGCWFCSAGSFP